MSNQTQDPSAAPARNARRKKALTWVAVVVAVIGAFLAGYFLSPIFHVGTINSAITIPTMLVTLLGSIILLAIVNLFRGRGRI